ncbi:hypothetical protein E2C01_007710 [Portunus trituberculatus]|uniref:Uncharacterized protein n=1 Tax=Portunus trituberculatus TaxID=210409 RepID=A0A5B7D156_PORTR|nr:hypothetical protein [Portunus trituberculatus]
MRRTRHRRCGGIGVTLPVIVRPGTVGSKESKRCINTLKRKGLSTPPCGVPRSNPSTELRAPLNKTQEVLLRRYSRTHPRRLPLTPKSTSWQYRRRFSGR